MEPRITPPARLRHLPYLDALRGLAILGVLVNHLLPLPGGLYYGWMGVELFFVLSGFLITRILLAERDDAEAAGTRGAALVSFYARRALRIFPIYYLSVFALYLLGAPGMRQHLPYYLSYTYNFCPLLMPNVPVGAPHFWSLCVEEQFYVLWPFLMLFVPRRFLPATMLAVALVAPGTRLVFALQHRSRLWLYLLSPCCLDCLAMGGLLAWAESRVGTERLVRSGVARACKFLGFPLMALFVYLAARRTPLLLPRWFGPELDVVWVVGNTAQAIFFTYVVARSCDPGHGDWQRLLSLDGLRFMGKISYGLYVYHMILWARVLEPVWPKSSPVAVPTFWAGVPASFLVAVVSWYALERPILSLKDRFTQERVRRWFRRPPAEVAAAPAERRAA